MILGDQSGDLQRPDTIGASGLIDHHHTSPFLRGYQMRSHRLTLKAFIVILLGLTALARDASATSQTLYPCTLCADNCWDAAIGCAMLCSAQMQSCNVQQCTSIYGDTYNKTATCE
jgi:hypothetical protein